MRYAILSVIGARPQFIKAAVVSRALAEVGIQEWIVHTGQHYDDAMSGRLLRELGINNIVANLDCRSGSHATQTAQMMIGLEKLMLENRKDIRAVLVYGDTNSSIAAALSASKLSIPVIHIESGLRSFNRAMPEEINRIVVDHLSDLLFCSSEVGTQQLTKEGITKPNFNVGDVMLDAFEHFLPVALNGVQNLAQESSNYSIVTIHRPSNTDNSSRLSTLLEQFAKTNCDFIWPVHPRLGNKLHDRPLPENVKLVAPLSYFEMLKGLSQCNFVVTDSGGLQKEAYWAKKQCITVRDETEWTETVESGWNTLWNPLNGDLASILNRKPTELWKPLYGDGNSCRRIANTINKLFPVL
jgi:UDP-N-acetylglucosamine 2-epimerase